MAKKQSEIADLSQLTDREGVAAAAPIEGAEGEPKVGDVVQVARLMNGLRVQKDAGVIVEIPSGAATASARRITVRLDKGGQVLEGVLPPSGALDIEHNRHWPCYLRDLK